jgi:hypothetical protein
VRINLRGLEGKGANPISHLDINEELSATNNARGSWDFSDYTLGK